MSLAARIFLLMAAVGLAGCAAGAGTPTSRLSPTPADPRTAAYAEATRIVAQAEATAIILAARATAQAQIQAASAPSQSPGAAQPLAPSATPRPVQGVTPTAAPPGETPGAGPQPTPLGPVFTPIAVNGPVKIVGLAFAAEGLYLIIQFLAPAQIAQTWFQGSASLTDEATGLVYNEVPVVGTIGPLFARPKVDGQLGYVMLKNIDGGIRPGTVVTVALGEYRFEHLVMQGP